MAADYLASFEVIRYACTLVISAHAKNDAVGFLAMNDIFEGQIWPDAEEPLTGNGVTPQNLEAIKKIAHEFAELFLETDLRFRKAILPSIFLFYAAQREKGNTEPKFTADAERLLDGWVVSKYRIGQMPSAESYAAIAEDYRLEAMRLGRDWVQDPKP